MSATYFRKFGKTRLGCRWGRGRAPETDPESKYTFPWCTTTDVTPGKSLTETSPTPTLLWNMANSQPWVWHLDSTESCCGLNTSVSSILCICCHVISHNPYETITKCVCSALPSWLLSIFHWSKSQTWHYVPLTAKCFLQKYKKINSSYGPWLQNTFNSISSDKTTLS